ncbi:MAG: F0F1 ATP synthase subunit alpha [Thermomicrobiales bacterium]
MSVRATEIRDILRSQIQDFDASMRMTNVGNVIEVGDGIATVYGLSDVRANELVEFQTGSMGMAFNLQEDSVGVIILGEYLDIEEGHEVRTTGQIAAVPVGDALVGRVVNALGEPIDGKGPISTEKTRPVERIAPGVIERQNVDTALQTGVIAVDAMIPIGRGQRELIIGDRQTGKTAIAIDSIINQRDSDVVCIYVAVGQRRAQVAQLVATLEANGAMDNTIVVAATASDPAPMQFIAPYAGCAMGEEIMENGGHALIVYDDLSKHAWAYRQVSLLMRRPPGREAYPGDVFYLHSRLLERAAQLSEDRGGGSLTALPIIETQANDVSAYIPTNVISITDGQMFLESDLFYAGVRPALNVGISVSRVGGDAQIRAMRQVAGQLRLDLAQYRSLEAFAQFGTEDLDAATRRQLERGSRMTEMLKQPQFQPLPVENQVAVLFAASRGFVDDIPVDQIQAFRSDFIEYMESSHRGLLDQIVEKGRIDDDLEEAMQNALRDFKSTYTT